MEVEVKRVASSSEIGFVALPLHLIYTLQQGDAQVCPLLVLELSVVSNGTSAAARALAPWFVAWIGASSNSACIEVPKILAECIGIPDHARVNVRVRADVPEAETVQVEPATEDDSEILELHADFLESHILSKVGVLQEGRRFPISVPGQGILVLLAKSTAPRSVVKLVPGTELIVSMKRRRSNGITTLQKGKDIWLRVENLDISLHQLTKLGKRDIVVIPTATVYISSATAASVSLKDGQWVTLNSNTRRPQNGIPKLDKTVSEKASPVTSAVVRVTIWDGAAEGHVMVSRPLRQFLGILVHTGVCIQCFQHIAMQHTTAAELSPIVFRPPEDVNDVNTTIDNDHQLFRSNEVIQDNPEILLSVWIEAQAKAFLHFRDDPTITAVPSAAHAIVSIAEAPGDSDRQIRESNLLLRLEGDHLEGSPFSLDVGMFRQPSSPRDHTTEVQFGRPQYLHGVFPTEESEIKLPSFDSVWVKGTVDDALQRLRLLLTPNIRRTLRGMELPVPSGVLLHGPAACGKTQLALALARELSENKKIIAHKVILRCAELVGEAEKSTRRMLKDAILEAVQHAPSLVVFDDLDVLVPLNEGGGPQQSVTALAEYLCDLIDESQRTAPVAFLATASGPKALPTSLCSSGRFDYSIELGLPGARERLGILKHVISARGYDCPDDVTRRVATNCDGYDANDLEIIVERAIHTSAARFLTKKGSLHLTESDLDVALQDFVPAALKGVAKGGSTTTRLGWDDIGGLSEVCRVLKELLELPVKYPKLFANAPLRLRTGVLLYGPPGCGKTHVVASAAAACSLRYIPVKGPELLDKYIGASEKAVRDIFAKAAAAAPCILFFDEFDAIAPKRGHDNTGVTDRVVNQLLAELDGVSTLTGVFTFAATNRPDLIDAALLRPGRLDHLLFCDFPSESERLHILRVLSRHLPMEKDIDLEYLSRRSEGFSGADLKAVLSDAELEAVHVAIQKNTAERPVITMDMLKATLAKAIPLQEAERKRFSGIYKAFTSGRSSSKDLKGKKATLA